MGRIFGILDWRLKCTCSCLFLVDNISDILLCNLVWRRRIFGGGASDGYTRQRIWGYETQTNIILLFLTRGPTLSLKHNHKMVLQDAGKAFSFLVDRVAPTVKVESFLSQSTNSIIVPFTFTFSKEITKFPKDGIRANAYTGPLIIHVCNIWLTARSVLVHGM